MNISRNSLLTHSMMTPTERRAGRFLRAPDGHPGAPAGFDSGSGGDNLGGNSGDSSSEGAPEDNGGQAIDPNAFWSQPKETGDGTSKEGGDDSGDPGAALGKDLIAGIQSFQLPDLFNKEVGEELAEGNMEGANKQMAEVGRQIMQQSLVNSAKIVQHFGNQLMEQVRAEIANAMGGEKNESALQEAFPSMRDPAMKPMISGVFNQALKHTAGDRDKALEMTRGMLKAMGKAGSQDFGIPQSQSPDDLMGEGSSSLVEELLGRK